MRHSTPHATAFTPVGKMAFEQLISELKTAARFPLRIATIGTATFIDDDPAAEPVSYDRTIHLAESGSLREAITAVESRLVLDGIEGSAGDAVCFQPRIVTIVDREGRLVAAGEIRAKQVRWCHPVSSNREARQVVTEASRLRGMAFGEARLDNTEAARSLRYRASALEGRLSDAIWREPVREALLQAA